MVGSIRLHFDQRPFFNLYGVFTKLPVLCHHSCIFFSDGSGRSLG